MTTMPGTTPVSNLRLMAPRSRSYRLRRRNGAISDMRDSFSKCLIAAAQNDERVILLTGDHGYALFDEFRNAYPDRYLNVGVAEQNMVGVAAGMAKAGFHPILYGLSAFVPIRV